MRFQHPNTKSGLEGLLRKVRTYKDAVDYHAPVAGYNRELLEEVAEELHWARVYLEKATSLLSRWKLVGPNGSPTVQQRLKRTKKGHRP